MACSGVETEGAIGTSVIVVTLVAMLVFRSDSLSDGKPAEVEAKESCCYNLSQISLLQKAIIHYKSPLSTYHRPLLNVARTN